MLHSPQWFLSGGDQQIFSDYATLASTTKKAGQFHLRAA